MTTASLAHPPVWTVSASVVLEVLLGAMIGAAGTLAAIGVLRPPAEPSRPGGAGRAPEARREPGADGPDDSTHADE